jgi:hypothetical protein
LEEVKYSIQKLNNNRAPGPGALNAELLKIGENKLIGGLWKVIEKTWMEEKILRQWEEGLICPICKKGDCLIYENYCGISLLNTGYKVFSTILFQRLQLYPEKLVGNYQCGFRSGKSMSDQLHTMRQILEKMGEYRVNTFYLFVDLKLPMIALTEPNSSKLWRNFKSPENLMEITLRNIRCKAKTPSGITDLLIQKRAHDKETLYPACCLKLLWRKQ